MDETVIVGEFFMIFGGVMLIFAGLTALDSGILEIMLARAPGTFDREHPKEFARAWAKGIVIIALGPAVGGLAMAVLGKYGVAFLPVSMIVFSVIGGKLVSREVRKYKEEKSEEDSEFTK